MKLARSFKKGRVLPACPFCQPWTPFPSPDAELLLLSTHPPTHRVAGRYECFAGVAGKVGGKGMGEIRHPPPLRCLVPLPRAVREPPCGWVAGLNPPPGVRWGVEPPHPPPKKNQVSGHPHPGGLRGPPTPAHRAFLYFWVLGQNFLSAPSVKIFLGPWWAGGGEVDPHPPASRWVEVRPPPTPQAVPYSPEALPPPLPPTAAAKYARLEEIRQRTVVLGGCPLAATRRPLRGAPGRCGVVRKYGNTNSKDNAGGYEAFFKKFCRRGGGNSTRKNNFRKQNLNGELAC